MGNKRIPLDANKVYHIYNHAVGNENLFRSHENYIYFLRKYKEYVLPIADTFAFCLMPNHFHLAVRIKSEKELQDLDPEGFKNPRGLNLAISQKIGNFFNAYTKAYNKSFSRKGKLFCDSFERKEIISNDYFLSIIHYIHFNPVHHGFVNDIRNWKYSSFKSFLTVKPTNIKRDEVINWFGGLDAFYTFHQQEIDQELVLELEL